jgi:DNA ligase (NAD+)
VNFQEKIGFTSNRLTGKIFVFTGSLEKLNRRDAKELVQKLGGRSSSSISKNTDFVVAGSSAGAKLNKANELGIQIISEDEFLILTKNK